MRGRVPDLWHVDKVTEVSVGSTKYLKGRVVKEANNIQLEFNGNRRKSRRLRHISAVWERLLPEKAAAGRLTLIWAHGEPNQCKSGGLYSQESCLESLDLIQSGEPAHG